MVSECKISDKPVCQHARAQNMGRSVPFVERVTCTIAEACSAAGLGRTTLYELISVGALETVTIGRRRLVRVSSLLKLLGIASHENVGGTRLFNRCICRTSCVCLIERDRLHSNELSWGQLMSRCFCRERSQLADCSRPARCFSRRLHRGHASSIFHRKFEAHIKPISCPRRRNAARPECVRSSWSPNAGGFTGKLLRPAKNAGQAV
jgi:excisionase family DNA binding protein